MDLAIAILQLAAAALALAAAVVELVATRPAGPGRGKKTER